MVISQELLPSILLAAGVAVFVFVMLRRSRGVFRRAESLHGSGTRGDRSRFGQREPPSAAEPADYLRWQVEMQELSRDIRAEIDTKMRALSALHVVATQTLADLERAIAEARELHAALGPSRPALASSKPAGEPPRHLPPQP